MRLSANQITILKKVSAEVFGADARLMLFGSRVDDLSHGGDIDLYVLGFDHSISQQLDAKLRFLVKVKREIGDQRIDVVFAPTSSQPRLPVHLLAEKTGEFL